MRSDPPRKPLFGDTTMMYATIGIGSLSRPRPSYASAMQLRSLAPGGEEPDLKACALIARASRPAAQQEPR
jgi:hypothetical protein